MMTRISITLRPDQAELLKRAAKAMDISVSELLRESIGGMEETLTRLVDVAEMFTKATGALTDELRNKAGREIQNIEPHLVDLQFTLHAMQEELLEGAESPPSCNTGGTNTIYDLFTPENGVSGAAASILRLGNYEQRTTPGTRPGGPESRPGAPAGRGRGTG